MPSERQEGAPPTLVGYLERMSMVSPTDAKARSVCLMTVHAAKGLEFPVVLVTGLRLKLTIYFSAIGPQTIVVRFVEAV